MWTQAQGEREGDWGGKGKGMEGKGGEERGGEGRNQETL